MFLKKFQLKKYHILWKYSTDNYYLNKVYFISYRIGYKKKK